MTKRIIDFSYNKDEAFAETLVSHQYEKLDGTQIVLRELKMKSLHSPVCFDFRRWRLVKEENSFRPTKRGFFETRENILKEVLPFLLNVCKIEPKDVREMKKLIVPIS